jgi:hypothetical protein
MNAGVRFFLMFSPKWVRRVGVGREEGWEFPFLRRGEFPLRTINLPSYPYRKYIVGRAALSNCYEKQRLKSMLRQKPLSHRL